MYFMFVCRCVVVFNDNEDVHERISSHDPFGFAKYRKKPEKLFFSRILAEDLCHSTSPGRPQLQDSTLTIRRYSLNVVIFKCAKITFARTF